MKEKRILPPKNATDAYVHMVDAAEHVKVTLARVRGSQALSLPAGVEEKLVEAQQALFAAQRLMEAARDTEG